MFSSLSRRRLVALLVLTSLLLITLDRNNNPVISRVRRVFGVVTEPFETAVRVVALPIERAWNSFTNYDDLSRENERLRDLVENQRGAEVVSVANQLRLNDLLAINRLLALGNHRSLISRVVGEAPGNFQNSVEISVGARDGIAVGMPVTDGAGLVGRISQVKSSSSVVLLITDPGYHISAEVLMAQRVEPAEGEETATSDDPAAGDSTPATALDGTPLLDPTAGSAPEGATPENATPGNTTPEGATPGNTTPENTTPGATTPGTDPIVPEDEGLSCEEVAAMPSQMPSSPTTTSSTVPTIRVPSDPAVTTTTPAVTTTTVNVPSVIRETGTLSGQTGEKPLLLEHVADSSGRINLCVGALVSTAGGAGSLAPQGIPIGRISKIQRMNETGSRAPVVEVTPNAKLSQLNFVAVVLFVPHDEAAG